jgi:hypothetical protein
MAKQFAYSHCTQCQQPVKGEAMLLAHVNVHPSKKEGNKVLFYFHPQQKKTKRRLLICSDCVKKASGEKSIEKAMNK